MEHQQEGDLLRLPPGFDSPDPIDGNPFPEGDIRRDFWDRATRTAEEEILRLNDAFLRGCPPQLERLPWIMAMFQARYEIWARRGFQVVLAEEMIQDWDQWLAIYANETLKTFESFLPPDMAIQELRDALVGRREHWKAEGRRNVAFQKSRKAKLAGPTDPISGGGGEPEIVQELEERAGETGQELVTPAPARAEAQVSKPKHPDRDEFLKPYLLKRTRNAIAEGAEMENSSLQRWHEGKSKLNPDNKEKLAKHLKVDPLTIPND